MNTYKYFDMEVCYGANIVKREHVNVHYCKVDLSRPVTLSHVDKEETSFFLENCILV